MRYIGYYIDTFGQVRQTVQSESEDFVCDMLSDYNDNVKGRIVEKTRFLVSVDTTVMIFTKVYI